MPIRDFVVYYGQGPLPGLERYDVAVLEPRGWTRQALMDLRRTGVRVLAYLSVLEVAEWELASTGLAAGDLLRIDGQPWQRPQFDTVVVDPRSERWRRHLEGRTADLVAAGWDGLFVDGLGDLEDPLVRGQLAWLLPAAATLMAALGAHSAGRLVVMNNGIWSILPWVAAYLDAVCWEVDEAPTAVGDAHIGAALDRLAGEAVRHGLGRWLLSVVPEGAPDGERRRAAFTAFATSMGFLSYVAPCDYAQGIRTLDGDVRRAPGPGRR